MKKFMTALAVIALAAFAAPALAANPFMDVPADHWAYDAVAQLASRGVASGYPDGAYKGAQPTTRYEMASMVARALANVDTEKAGKQDVELLKKLSLEFKNELDALGVRVAALEKSGSGWTVGGIFTFDAKFADSDADDNVFNSNKKENEFTKERFRLFVTKQIDEKTSFYAQYRTGNNGAGGSGRGDQDHMRWSHLYVDTKLPGDFGFRAGRFGVDFEDVYGLYTDNDGVFGLGRVDGFQFKKSWGALNATAVAGRNFSAVGHEMLDKGKFAKSPDILDIQGTYTEDHMAYALDVSIQPSEKFFLGASGYMMKEDNDGAFKDVDINTYGFYAGYSVTPNIALKGIYYLQNNSINDIKGMSNVTNVTGNFDDSPNAWKAILDVKQEALKFTSLWVEYSQTDNTFLSATSPRYSIGNVGAHVMYNRPINNETTKVLFVKAEQKWNDKLGTWLRYAQADFDTNGLDDAKEYGVGVSYQYTPTVRFELACDRVDYGSGNKNIYDGVTIPVGSSNYNLGDYLTQPRNDKESVIRFRTTINF